MTHTGLALLSAALAGLAAYLGASEFSLRRLQQEQRWQGPAWLVARPGAMPAARRAQVATLAAVAVALVVSHPLLVVLVVGAVTAAGVYLGLGRIESRRQVSERQRLVADLPHALDLLEGCLAAGLPLRTAVSAVASALGGVVADRLERVTAHVGVGFSDAQAWQALADDPVLGPVARDLARGCDAGSSLLPVLHEHAVDARAAASAQVQRRARALGVTAAVPVSLCFLPAFFLVGVVPAIAGILAPFLR